jgi:hypothetical protein
MKVEYMDQIKILLEVDFITNVIDNVEVKVNFIHVI